MPKDMPVDMKIEAVAGKPVELPSGDFVANAAMSREGMDLHLTTPDGHTIVVEGYFAQTNPPDLVTHDGARLTSAMVDAFVPPEHAGQYAASGQIASDQSPAGRITQEVGDAHIIHADGTRVAATVGTPIYQGDVVETAKTGAVNIQFADNTTFAISENARMSVDQFVYHTADHSGSTFFSMLQGVFVYTSGLIGKTDAANVGIETPVGSIGIRGTVVAGHIMPAGQQSEITIVDGAITVTNGAGTQDLSQSLSSVAVTGYQSALQPIQLDANTFNSSYHAVAPVMGDYLTHFTGMNAPSTTTAPATDHTAPTTTAPTGESAPATTAPATAAPAAHDQSAPAPTGSNTPTAPSSSESATTQAMTSPTAATTATPTTSPTTATTSPTSSTNFNTGSTSTFTTSGTTTFTSPTANTTSSTGTISTTTATTTTSPTTTTTTTTTTVAPITFSLQGTETINGSTSDGIVGMNTPITYTLTFNETPSAVLTTNNFSNHIDTTAGGASVRIDSVTQSATNPNVYTVVVEATSTGSLQMQATGVTDLNGNALTNNMQSHAEIVTQANLVGGSGDDVFGITSNSFAGIDGYGGKNVLDISGNSTHVDLTVAGAGIVRNISEIDLGSSTGSDGIGLTLNAQNAFDMTSSIAGAGAGMLTIKAMTGAAHDYVDLSHGNFTLTQGIWGVDQMLTYTGVTANGNHVTVNVQEFAAAGDGLGNAGSLFVEDSAHTIALSSYTTNTTAYATANNELLVGTATFGQTLSDGGHTGDILVGNSSGGGNSIYISNPGFSYIDGGTETAAQYANNGNTLYFQGSGMTVDFTLAHGTAKNIDWIQLAGNSAKLNIQDVFSMTNVADNHTLIIENNSGTVSNLNVVANSSGFHEVTGSGLTGLLGGLLGGVLGSSGAAAYQGTYMGQQVTLVIDGANAHGLLNLTPASVHVAAVAS